MYNIIRQGDTDQYNVVSLVADSRTDINSLPVDFASGSTCMVTEDSSVWIFSPNKQWKELV